MSQREQSSTGEGRSVFAALFLAVGLALWRLGQLAIKPGSFLVGNHIHPDNLANQWLLPWAVDTALAGGQLLHTTAYYWPVGDAPLLSGDGTQALFYAPAHLLFGWPTATPVYVGMVLVLNGLSGWALARSVLGRGAAALVAIPIVGISPFVAMELSAGRFSQAAMWPLLGFFAVWWSHVQRPRLLTGIASAGMLAMTAFSYWYYGWFGVLGGAVVWGVHHGRGALDDIRVNIRQHALFSATFIGLIAPWAALFLSQWASVPGSGEVVFPPQSASIDRLPMLPVLAAGNPTTSSALQSLVGLLLGAVGVGLSRNQRALRPWVALGAVFVALGWGPAFPGAPYTVLYGLTAALRRFWWPIRHVVVVQAALGVLAAGGLRSLAKRSGGPWLVGAGIAGVVAALVVQGAPVQIERTPLSFPPEGYAELSALEAGTVLQTPLAPEVTGTNDAMLHQLAHGHPQVMGHAPWVARARPPEWDRWLASDPLLSSIAELERSGWPGGAFPIPAGSVEELVKEGVRWVVVDRTLVPLKLKALVRAEDALFDGLFGRPVVRTADVAVWDTHAYTGTKLVIVPAFSWPSGLRHAGPEWPLASRRPDSPMLGTPSGAAR